MQLIFLIPEGWTKLQRLLFAINFTFFFPPASFLTLHFFIARRMGEIVDPEVMWLAGCFIAFMNELHIKLLYTSYQLNAQISIFI